MRDPPRLLLAAGTVAASLVAIGPVLANNGSPAASPDSLRVGATGSSMLVVPADASMLSGTAFGRAAIGTRIHLTIERVPDGATLFTGSVRSFHGLPVAAGTTLRVQMRPAGRVRGPAGRHRAALRCLTPPIPFRP